MQSNDIFKIIKLPEPEKNLRIKEIIKYLKDTYKTHRTLGYITPTTYSKPYYGFIPNNVKIYYNLANNYYKIADDTYLFNFLNYLNCENIVNTNEAILKIPSFLEDYFGKRTTRTLKKENFLTSSIPNYLNLPTISSLKKKNVADALEYSLLAENILTLLGYDTFHLIGEYKTKNIQELYGFNIIFINKNYYLFDFYNAVPIYNQIGEVMYNHPYQMKINPEEINLFLKGQKAIELSEYRRVVSNKFYQQIPTKGKRIYSLTNIIN